MTRCCVHLKFDVNGLEENLTLMSASRWAWCATKRYVLCVLRRGERSERPLLFGVGENRGMVVLRFASLFCVVRPWKSAPILLELKSRRNLSLSNSRRRHRSHKGTTIVADRSSSYFFELTPVLSSLRLRSSPRMIEKRGIGGTFRGCSYVEPNFVEDNAKYTIVSSNIWCLAWSSRISNDCLR